MPILLLFLAVANARLAQRFLGPIVFHWSVLDDGDEIIVPLVLTSVAWFEGAGGQWKLSCVTRFCRSLELNLDGLHVRNARGYPDAPRGQVIVVSLSLHAVAEDAAMHLRLAADKRPVE